MVQATKAQMQDPSQKISKEKGLKQEHLSSKWEALNSNPKYCQYICVCVSVCVYACTYMHIHMYI
jgi:hypothetical protein